LLDTNFSSRLGRRVALSAGFAYLFLFPHGLMFFLDAWIVAVRELDVRVPAANANKERLSASEKPCIKINALHKTLEVQKASTTSHPECHLIYPSGCAYL